MGWGGGDGGDRVAMYPTIVKVPRTLEVCDRSNDFAPTNNSELSNTSFL